MPVTPLTVTDQPGWSICPWGCWEFFSWLPACDLCNMAAARRDAARQGGLESNQGPADGEPSPPSAMSR
jgi:hypothetical protein